MDLCHLQFILVILYRHKQKVNIFKSSLRSQIKIRSLRIEMEEAKFDYVTYEY